MKRFALPLLAMALSSPAYAQDIDPNWTGYYIGAEVSGLLDGELEIDLGVATGIVELDGLQYGLFGGYRYELGSFVIGGEYDFSGARTELVGLSGSTRLSLHRGGVELGYAVGRFLPYATAGIAHIRFRGEGGTFTDTGTFAGVGLDYRLRGASTLGVEVNGFDFGPLDGGFPFPTTPELTTVGINYSVSF